MNLKAGDKIKLSYRQRGSEKDGNSKKVVRKLKVLAVYNNFILAWNGRYRECINRYDIDINAVHIEKV